MENLKCEAKKAHPKALNRFGVSFFIDDFSTLLN